MLYNKSFELPTLPVLHVFHKILHNVLHNNILKQYWTMLCSHIAPNCTKCCTILFCIYCTKYCSVLHKVLFCIAQGIVHIIALCVNENRSWDSQIL